MPFVNHVETDLEAAVPPRPVNLVITDGDETIFPPDSAEPFDGSLQYLHMLDPEHLALVSANPDRELALARADAIGADSVSIPRVATWVKYGLFHHAISQAVEHTHVESAAVLGNRWMMDVTIGRLALFKRGIADNYGVFMRFAPTNERFDRIVTGPVETVGAVAAKAFRLDGYIRPRQTERV